MPEGRDEIDHTDQLLTSWLVAEAVTSLSAGPPGGAARVLLPRGVGARRRRSRLGIPEGTVKSRTHYALRALRLALQEMGVGA